jgi:hypothetical protein
VLGIYIRYSPARCIVTMCAWAVPPSGPLPSSRTVRDYMSARKIPLASDRTLAPRPARIPAGSPEPNIGARRDGDRHPRDGGDMRRLDSRSSAWMATSLLVHFLPVL